MALTREQKVSVVTDLSELLKESKMTVFAHYDGMTVADIQQLRRSAKENNVTIKVVKNRLIKIAALSNDNLKNISTDDLKGQLLYAIGTEDEVAPAQVLANFAKTNPNLKLSGAFSAAGNSLQADEVKALATLPSKNELIAQVIATLMSAVNDITSGLSGDLHGLLDGIAAKA